MDDTLSKKVLGIFAELAGDRISRLDGSVPAEPAMSTIAAAFSTDFDPVRAHSLGFHMADWNSDAAFMVALHLFPERFTEEEIQEGVWNFLWHAPNHIGEACRITSIPVSQIFSDDDANGPPDP